MENMQSIEQLDNFKLKLAQFKLLGVLERLEEAIKEPMDSHQVMMDATTQRFKFTFELLWRWLKLIILERGGMFIFLKTYSERLIKPK